MLKSFRFVSLIEGLSLITLFFVAMPARHYTSYDFVWPVGMAHGLLWLLFFVFSLVVSHRQGWSVFGWLGALLCSVIPLGFLVLDRRLRPAAQA